MLGITCIDTAGNYDDSRWFVNYYNSQISSIRIEKQKRECTAHRLQAAVREDSVMVHGGRSHPRA